ncbi:TPA: SDR family oxidoreductase [Yersinia enterocolitica]|uniref:SDR family oxidoreductase n=2 Tax=Yersinia enterocolitica TaxID=630 RepID=A0A7T9XVK3_YEREN|nr:SDR family oxidoreductase [Yersinia enterocolitica]EHB19650.1 short chain dehydrogenase [Yersinia enterocolitica subsp. palearctica PhRBD_Ye1]EKN3315389.1 SDR family oxidoreductase [Yersinia enterocolitica]EKN3319154.1 SDR family oxidoreductase [Yersinia enterocolitica]EKN3323562.1 SDR family oxidoreductase [Yersinia enterocolitica]EKN3335433.1 SDR family oxidoreductase [Yersinia enterocolitica]
MNRLKDKYALITGGTSSIGLETARQFLAEGATVAITGRSETALQAAHAEIGERVLLLKSDASNIADQLQLAAKLAENWPRLDIVYINAGDVTHHPIEEWDESSFERVLSTNLKGPFFLLQSLLPLLANPASVILCGSASVHIGLPQSSVYAASKAGLLSLARTLSGEWAERGIRVNGLSPGPTQTPALQKLGLSGREEEKLTEQIRQLVPIKRMGTAAEIAHAAVFLASDESSFVVGTEFRVDGGVSSL